MKWYFLLVLLSEVLAGSAQCNKLKNEFLDSTIKDILTSRGQLFLITRGTLSKRTMIGKGFNVIDTNSTHVAIGIAMNGKIKVFSVEDQPGERSQLRVSSLCEFLFPSDVFYICIWLAKIRSKELKAFSRLCNKFQSRKIQFDYEFALKNGDRYYCSEFCAEVLNRIFPPRFRFKPMKKEISGFYRNVLGRSEITYFPVDFFQTSARFTKLAEYEF